MISSWDEDELKFGVNFLHDNNYSLHSVYFGDSDEKNRDVGAFYCRSCSEYILVQTSVIEKPFAEVIQDVSALSQDAYLEENYTFRMVTEGFDAASLDSRLTFEN